MIRHFFNLLLWGLPPSRLFSFRRLCLRLGNVAVGDNVSVCGRGWIYGRGRFSIGSNTWLSPGVIVHTNQDADICIGERCDVGPGVEFIPGGHEIGLLHRRAGKGIARLITVGNGCWIGAKCIILGGVTIGEGSVVAAGAVVTDDVEPNTFVAGVPAEFKRNLDSAKE